MKTKEFIIHEEGDKDAWICVCGNMPAEDGFYPCDNTGNEMEPLLGSTWNDLYVCAKCGRIVNQHSLEVIGQNAQFKLLS